MPTLQQKPGQLDFVVTSTDDFSYLLDFDIALTGYTFTAAVVKEDGTEQAIAIASTNLATGQITLSLTAAQITALLAVARRWYLKWTTGGVTRTVLAGNYSVEKYT